MSGLDMLAIQQSLGGGLLIGLAVSLLIVLNGRIAGISGILGGLLHAGTMDVAWRVTFLAGLVLAPMVYGHLGSLPIIEIDADTTMLVIAGLLVGLGTRYGSGCTSGHGICGVARLSPRSLTATAVFMSSAMLTVYIARHLIGGA
ncbi:MAG TPA: YeeE/YedE family protein [Methylophilaceae bacterium]|nr:YeeE/YedE family protein [Methylophilaceae bacterium]